MKSKLLIGVLIALCLAITALNPLVGLILAVVVWIYLVRMVRKQEDIALTDQIEVEITERHLRRVKTLLKVAGFAFVIFIAGAIVHNVLYDPSELENTVSFLIALLALCVFVLATAGGMVIFLKERPRRTQTA